MTTSHTDRSKTEEGHVDRNDEIEDSPRQRYGGESQLYRKHNDSELLEAAGILEGQRVFIVNNNNGERFDTYVIAGEPGSGVICLNGAAARKAQPGDVIIIITYALMTQEEARDHRPTVIFPVTRTNRLKRGV